MSAIPVVGEDPSRLLAGEGKGIDWVLNPIPVRKLRTRCLLHALAAAVQPGDGQTFSAPRATLQKLLPFDPAGLSD